MGSIVSGISNAVSSAVSSVSSGVTDFVNNVESSVSDVASGILQQATSGFDNLVSGASDAISSLASGNFPDLGKLASGILGSIDPTGTLGSIEKTIAGLISKANGSSTLENGTAVNTGAVAGGRDMNAEIQALMDQVKALIAAQQNGGTAGTSSSTGAATGTGSTTATSTSSTASTSGSGDASSIISAYNAQASGGDDGLSSYQSGILKGIKDPDQRAQMKAQMQMSNLSRDAAFYSEMAKLMNESLTGIIRNMG